MDIDIHGRGIAQIDDDESDPTCERCDREYTMEAGDVPTPFCDRCAHDVLEEQSAELDSLRTTIARLTAELAQAKAQRDELLEGRVRPAEGEFRRMREGFARFAAAERSRDAALANADAALSAVEVMRVERDEARGLLVDLADGNGTVLELRARIAAHLEGK